MLWKARLHKHICMQTNSCQTQLGVFCRLVSHLRPVISLLADTGFGLDCVSQTSGRQPAGFGFRFFFFFFSSDLKLKPQTFWNLLSAVVAMLMSPAYPSQAMCIHKCVQRSSDKLINDEFLLEGDKGRLGKEQAIWELWPRSGLHSPRTGCIWWAAR